MDFFKEHRAKMVQHFIWLESIDPDYAVYALNRYRKNPDCPCPDILSDIKAEKARRKDADHPPQR